MSCGGPCCSSCCCSSGWGDGDCWWLCPRRCLRLLPELPPHCGEGSNRTATHNLQYSGSPKHFITLQYNTYNTSHNRYGIWRQE
jgi:hypothetical protein